MRPSGSRPPAPAWAPLRPLEAPCALLEGEEQDSLYQPLLLPLSRQTLRRGWAASRPPAPVRPGAALPALRRDSPRVVVAGAVVWRVVAEQARERVRALLSVARAVRR